MRHPFQRIGLAWLIFVPVVAWGAKIGPKEFTILGNQVITRQVAPTGATSEENEFIKIEVTGLMTQIVDGGGSTMTRTFGFSLKRPLQLKRVTVEDVTGATAELLVTDESPVVTKDYWKGDATKQMIGRDTTAWLYAPGDDWRVFRFTVSTDRGEMVFLQPSVIVASSKQLYVEAVQQAALRPSTERLQQLLDSAAKLMPKGTEALMLSVTASPGSGDLGLLAALKQARKRKVTMVVVSSRADWALAVVGAALGKAKKGQFKDQVLVVVAPAADAVAFTPLGATSGIEIRVGTTGE